MTAVASPEAPSRATFGMPPKPTEDGVGSLGKALRTHSLAGTRRVRALQSALVRVPRGTQAIRHTQGPKQWAPRLQQIRQRSNGSKLLLHAISNTRHMLSLVFYPRCSQATRAHCQGQTRRSPRGYKTCIWTAHR